MLSKSRLKLGLWLIPLLIVALVGCSAVQAAPPAQDAASAGPVRTITVVGVGKANIKPDIARINVGVEARAAAVADAKAQVDQQMAAILSALQELGIEEKDVQTSYYGINYETDPYGPVLTEGAVDQEKQGAYRVSNMVEVTVRNIDRAGLVLDAVVTAGANQVYGVTFTVADDTAWQSMAREKAVADAKARAQELAGLAGVEVREVLSISEVIGGSPVQGAVMEKAYGGGGIAPGELELSTQVQVTFALQ